VYPTSNAPTPGSAVTYNGGTKISTVTGSQFVDESLGDVMLYATNANQQLLIGNPTFSGRSALAIGSNQVAMHSPLVCTSLIGTTGISLSLGGPLSNSVPPNLTGLATQMVNDTLFAKATAASNQIFAPMAMEAYYSNANNGLCNLYTVCNVAYKPPVTYMSNVTMCNNCSLSVGGPIGASNNVTMSGSNCQLTIGSNGNPSMYPLMVQTATQDSGVSLYIVGDMGQSSDRRWKTEIEPIADALDKVLAIGGYTFRRMGYDGAQPSETQKRAAGVLAQEVQAVLPEVVDTDGEGRLVVAYPNLSALLIEATKQLAKNRAVLRVTTTAADEAFSLELPDAASWAASAAAGNAATFVTGVDAYSRAQASIDPATGRVVGRVEAPGTYSLLVVR
jgi:hypothetical protein